MKISSVLCSIDGCDRPNRKRGWCEMHYSRWKRHGDPEHADPTPEERFWSHVDVRGSDDCWPWTGSTNGGGYGTLSWEGRTASAHRVSFMFANGPVPRTVTVDHECHNRDDTCVGGPTCVHRRCVNPAHLDGVSFQTNVRRGKGPAGIAFRKTHCPAKHPYDTENTVWYRGHRYCRACQRRRRAVRYAVRGV